MQAVATLYSIVTLYFHVYIIYSISDQNTIFHIILLFSILRKLLV